MQEMCRFIKTCTQNQETVLLLGDFNIMGEKITEHFRQLLLQTNQPLQECFDSIDGCYNEMIGIFR